MENLFDTVLQTSLYASITGIVLILFKSAMKNKMSPKWHYAIWIVFILKLLIPFGPESHLSLFNLIPKVTSQATKAIPANDKSTNIVHGMITIKKSPLAEPLNVAYPVTYPSKGNVLNGSTKDSIPIISIIWLTVAVLIIAWLIYTNYSLKMQLKNNKLSNEHLEAILEECKKKAGVHKNIKLIVQNTITTPSLFGAFKPVILVTPSLLNLSEKNISCIFLHELSHYKRKDILANYLLLIIQSIHWFNPVIWLCIRKIRQDMEVAADYEVLNLLNHDEQKEYGKTILALLEALTPSRLSPKPKPRPNLIGIISDKNNIKRRILMIKMNDFFKSKNKIISAASLIAILLLGCVLLTNSINAETSQKSGIKVAASDTVKFLSLENIQENSVNEINVLPVGKSDLDKVHIDIKDKKVIQYFLESLNFLQISSLKKPVTGTSSPNGVFITWSSGKKNMSCYIDTSNGNMDTKYSPFMSSFPNFTHHIDNIKAFEQLLNSAKYKNVPDFIKASHGFVSTNTKVYTKDFTINTSIRYTENFLNDRVMVKLKFVNPQKGKYIKIFAYYPEFANKSSYLYVSYTILSTSSDRHDSLILPQSTFENGRKIHIIPIYYPTKANISSPTNTAASQAIETPISNAIKAQGRYYGQGEVGTEGHITLDVATTGNIIKAYTIASYAAFGFENGIFTMVSGSSSIPTVITFSRNSKGQYTLLSYKEPEDGERNLASTKELFPEKLWNKVLNTKDFKGFPSLSSAEEAQAKAYLKSIGRNAKVSVGYVDKKLPSISDRASNKLFSEYIKSNKELAKFPYWIGTRELPENGVRYIYETSQSKTSDGYPLITFTKKQLNGKIAETIKYKIVNSEPMLIK